MLSFLSALLALVNVVVKYLDRQSVEASGAAKEIIAAWERNNGLVTTALAAGEAKRTELNNDPGSVRTHDEFERPD